MALEVGSEMVLEADSEMDSEAGFDLDSDLAGSASAGSDSSLDLDLVSASIRSFSADAGAVDLAGASAGIRGGEVIHTIRTGEVMAGTVTVGTTILDRTVLT